MFYGAPSHVFEKARELHASMTETEQILWEHLKKSKLKGFKFRRQHPVSEFIADFYCHRAKLVVEVDGGIHELGRQKYYDIRRSEVLNRLGITVIRFSNEQVKEDVEGVVKRIASWLELRTL